MSARALVRGSPLAAAFPPGCGASSSTPRGIIGAGPARHPPNGMTGTRPPGTTASMQDRATSQRRSKPFPSASARRLPPLLRRPRLPADRRGARHCHRDGLGHAQCRASDAPHSNSTRCPDEQQREQFVDVGLDEWRMRGVRRDWGAVLTGAAVTPAAGPAAAGHRRVHARRGLPVAAVVTGLVIIAAPALAFIAGSAHWPWARGPARRLARRLRQGLRWDRHGAPHVARGIGVSHEGLASEGARPCGGEAATPLCLGAA